jgi:hypothetical protein
MQNFHAKIELANVCQKKKDLMTEKDNSFNLKYATFSAKKFKWQVLTNFYMYTIGTKSYRIRI